MTEKAHPDARPADRERMRALEELSDGESEYRDAARPDLECVHEILKGRNVSEDVSARVTAHVYNLAVSAAHEEACSRECDDFIRNCLKPQTHGGLNDLLLVIDIFATTLGPVLNHRRVLRAISRAIPAFVAQITPEVREELIVRLARLQGFRVFLREMVRVARSEKSEPVSRFAASLINCSLSETRDAARSAETALRHIAVAEKRLSEILEELCDTRAVPRSVSASTFLAAVLYGILYREVGKCEPVSGGVERGTCAVCRAAISDHGFDFVVQCSTGKSHYAHGVCLLRDVATRAGTRRALCPAGCLGGQMARLPSPVLWSPWQHTPDTLESMTEQMQMRIDSATEILLATHFKPCMTFFIPGVEVDRAIADRIRLSDVSRSQALVGAPRAGGEAEVGVCERRGRAPPRQLETSELRGTLFSPAPGRASDIPRGADFPDERVLDRPTGTRRATNSEMRGDDGPAPRRWAPANEARPEHAVRLLGARIPQYTLEQEIGLIYREVMHHRPPRVFDEDSYFSAWPWPWNASGALWHPRSVSGVFLHGASHRSARRRARGWPF